MPNWCENELVISGPKQDVEDLLSTMSAPKTEVTEHGVINNVIVDTCTFSFGNIIPYPMEYEQLDRAYEAATRMISKMTHSEREKYFQSNGRPRDGYNSGGYEWCKANWGTKWDACDVLISKRKPSKSSKAVFYDVSFQTAWTPPRPVIHALSLKYPKVRLALKYWERGAGFRGSLIMKGGRIISQSQKAYSGRRGG